MPKRLIKLHDFAQPVTGIGGTVIGVHDDYIIIKPDGRSSPRVVLREKIALVTSAVDEEERLQCRRCLGPVAETDPYVHLGDGDIYCWDCYFKPEEEQ